MIAKKLINTVLPPLKMTDTGDKAISWFKEFHVQYFPVVEGNKYLGILSEYDVLDLNKPTLTLSEYPIKLSRPFVQETAHIYEIMKLLNEHRLTVIPALDEDENYVGAITIKDLLDYFTTINALHEPGGIIILQMHIKDYTLTKIAQIVEYNETKIMSMYIKSNPENPQMIDVTIKTNRSDLTSMCATFERYGYKIKGFYHETGYMEDMQDRLDSLMQYLNV